MGRIPYRVYGVWVGGGGNCSKTKVQTSQEFASVTMQKQVPKYNSKYEITNSKLDRAVEGINPAPHQKHVKKVQVCTHIIFKCS